MTRKITTWSTIDQSRLLDHFTRWLWSDPQRQAKVFGTGTDAAERYGVLREMAGRFVEERKLELTEE